MGKDDSKGFEVQIPADLAQELVGGPARAPAQGQPEAEETVVQVEVEAAPPGDGGGAADADRLSACEAELAQARAEAAEARERMLRVAADADNTRKRALRERQEAIKFGLEGVFKELLPLVDNLDRTLAHVPRDAQEPALAALRQGAEMILRQFLDVLARNQVSTFTSLGQPFDPARHEAISQKESREAPPGTVLEELHRGFFLNDRLLRPALVVVAQAPADAPAPPSEGAETAGEDPGEG